MTSCYSQLLQQSDACRDRTLGLQLVCSWETDKLDWQCRMLHRYDHELYQWLDRQDLADHHELYCSTILQL